MKLTCSLLFVVPLLFAKSEAGEKAKPVSRISIPDLEAIRLTDCALTEAIVLTPTTETKK